MGAAVLFAYLFGTATALVEDADKIWASLTPEEQTQFNVSHALDLTRPFTHTHTHTHVSRGEQ